MDPAKSDQIGLIDDVEELVLLLGDARIARAALLRQDAMTEHKFV